jgi:galactokinase
MPHKLAISAPGRICLFGEHQDYLGLPVIAAAISLRMRLTGTPRPDPLFHIDLPDIGERVEFIPNGRLVYQRPRDYFRSGFNVAWDRGFRPEHGWNCEVRGKVPINSGASSSSAMMVAWIKFLLRVAHDRERNDPEIVSRLAYQAEVREFNEPGGMMDQFSTCFGNVIYLDFPNNEVRTLQPKLGGFVLGDSQEPKDTMSILRNVREVAQEAVKLVRAPLPGFDLRQTSLEEARDALQKLPRRHAQVLRANLIDRDLLREAREVLQQEPLAHERLGELLNRHHEQLRDNKKVSTPKIERMLESAMRAGALGGKINGSGGGGSMFAYAPLHAEAVAEAIRAAGGVAYVVSIDEGARLEGDVIQDESFSAPGVDCSA